MPKADLSGLFDMPPFPIDLGRYTCGGKYIMPSGSVRDQERAEARRRITCPTKRAE